MKNNKIPPQLMEQTSIFSLGVHGQGSENQPCQVLMEVFLDALRLKLFKWECRLCKLSKLYQSKKKKQFLIVQN